MKAKLPWYFSPALFDRKNGCIVLFTLPFLAGGLLCLWSMALQPGLNWWNARSWVAADAVIDKAWVEVIDDSDGDSYKVAVEFRYQYRGTTHAGTRYSFVSSATNVGVNSMHKTVRGLPPGKTVTCWVNPADPEEVVIDRSLPGQVLLGLLFSTPFISVGVAGLSTLGLPWLRRRLLTERKAQLLKLVAQGRLPRWVIRPFESRAEQAGNDLALVIAADERLPQALGLTFINLFWNGIVSVFVFIAVTSFMSGESGEATMLSLFLIPFIVIGAGMFWFALKYWGLVRRSAWVAALQPVPDFQGGEARFCWAWLDAGRLTPASHAKVRIVARIAAWDEESGGPTRAVVKSRKNERELAAVEIPTLDITGDTIVHLPSAPPPPADMAKHPAWGEWWQLEVTYRDGEIENSDLTIPKKAAQDGPRPR